MSESTEPGHVSSAEIEPDRTQQDLPLVNISDLKDHVKLSVLEAFNDDSFLDKIKSVIASLLTPYKEALSTANAEIGQLKTQMSEKVNTIRALTKDIEDLKIKCDDIEQQGRKGSVRMFGVPESTPGTTDDKVLTILNENVKVSPKLTLDDIEVTHRVGRPPPVSSTSEGTEEHVAEAPGENNINKRPRAILIKFANRRIKTLVMDAKKNLKTNPYTDQNGKEYKVFIQDDLTSRRANLAFLARQAKRSHRISDTWVSFSKVLVKDNHGRIHTINTLQDLSEYEWIVCIPFKMNHWWLLCWLNNFILCGILTYWHM